MPLLWLTSLTMKNVFQVTNDRGVAFNVTVQAEKPCNGCDMAVAFYDDRYHDASQWKELGQFVSSYYMNTFLDIEPGRGLCLDGGNADVWFLTGKNVQEVKDWILSF